MEIGLVELPPERVRGRLWTIYICAEPDGQDCASGTHPNILTHKCAALKEWHEWHQDHPRIEDQDNAPRGPKIAMVDVAAVNLNALSDDALEAAQEAGRMKFRQLRREKVSIPILDLIEPISKYVVEEYMTELFRKDV